MYWFGMVLLALGSLILGLTNPWQFFQAAAGAFFDWSDTFRYFQWGGFWLVTASLLVFAGTAWRAPSTFVPRWTQVPPGIALLLFVAVLLLLHARKVEPAGLEARLAGRARVLAHEALAARRRGRRECAARPAGGTLGGARGIPVHHLAGCGTHDHALRRHRVEHPNLSPPFPHGL